MKKKILSGILVLAMMLTMLPTAFAVNAAATYEPVEKTATSESLYSQGQGATTVGALLFGDTTNLTLTKLSSDADTTNYSYSLSGAAAYVTGMTQFADGTSEYETGHYVALKLNKPADLDVQKDYSIHITGSKTPDKTYSTKITTMDKLKGEYPMTGLGWNSGNSEIFVTRLENLNGTTATYTIKYTPNNSSTEKTIVANVNFSNVVRAPQKLTIEVAANDGTVSVSGNSGQNSTRYYALVNDTAAFDGVSDSYTLTDAKNYISGLTKVDTSVPAVNKNDNGKYLVVLDIVDGKVAYKGITKLDSVTAEVKKTLTVDAGSGATVAMAATATPGTNVTSGTAVVVGTEMTATITLKTNYVLKSVTLNGVTLTASAQGKYEFTMPSVDATLKVVAEVAPMFGVAVFGGSTSLSDTDGVTVNGSDLHEGVVMTQTGTNSYKLTGKLVKKVGFTGFGGGASDAGHYLVLKFTNNSTMANPSNFKVVWKGNIEKEAAGSSFFSDGLHIMKIDDMKTNNLNAFTVKFVVTKAYGNYQVGDVIATYTFDISGLEFVTVASVTMTADSSGNVSGTIDSSAISSTLTDVKNNGKSELMVDATDSTGTGNTTTITLDDAAIQAINDAGVEDIKVVVKTNAGTVTLDRSVLALIEEQSDDVKLVVKTSSSVGAAPTTSGDYYTPVTGGTVVQVSVTDSTGATNVTVDRGVITLTVNFGLTSDQMVGKTIGWVSDDGTQAGYVSGTPTVNEDGTTTFQVGHLTKFYIAESKNNNVGGPIGGFPTGNVPGAGTTTPGTSDDKKDDEDKKDDTTSEVEIDFVDVTENDWFYDEIKWAYNKGVMFGRDGGAFAPNAEMTYLEVITAMARYAGETIDGTDWADKALEWGIADGITDGSDKTALITRERLVTLLARLAEKMDVTLSANGDLTVFPDAADLSDWAADAMTWAVGEGIINGMDGAMNPAGNTTRAQVVTVLMRFDALVNNAE